MSDRELRSIFESFNARALSLTQVAHTFVPSAIYRQLTKRCHTVLIGPRGSGKTTLLKMLQQPAIESWMHPEADEYRRNIDFTGVFIPTDIGWSEQLKSLGGGQLDDNIHQLLSISTFTTHVLRATVVSMLNRITPLNQPGDRRPFRRVALTPERETALARELCAAWHLKRTVPSLTGVKQALSVRLSEIKELAGRESLLDPCEREERLSSYRYLHLHFIQASSLGAEFFEDISRQPQETWALAFDELELAPNYIQDQLLRALRSTEPRFLFKLALSPFSANPFFMNDPSSAAVNQDFEQIALWHRTKREATEFCSNLWTSMVQREGATRINPKEVLGASYFEFGEGEPPGEGYGPDSRVARIFVNLAKRDESFADYLKHNAIDPLRLKRLSAAQRASDVRKVAPLVVVRDFYKSAERSDSVRQRSRKTASLYAGATSIFTISEGNPRWFIALVTKLLARWQDKSRKIDTWIQAEEIERAAQIFSALIRTIPIPPTVRAPGLLKVIKMIGERFHDGVVSDAFSDDPPLTFTVDSFTSADIATLLSQALNAGAIIYIPDKPADELILHSLRGKRFRISYLLAPLLKLPLRLGRSVALSKLITSGGDNSAQMTMTDEDGNA